MLFLAQEEGKVSTTVVVIVVIAAVLIVCVLPIVVIAVLALLGPAIGNVFSDIIKGL